MRGHEAAGACQRHAALAIFGSGQSVGANGRTPALLPSSFRFVLMPFAPLLSLGMGALALLRRSLAGIAWWRLTTLHLEALQGIRFRRRLWIWLRGPAR